jgi:hypothetical protein
MLGDKTVEDTKTGSPNRDPLSGTPGAHPVGVGVGAAAGGMAAGAAVGTVAGPVGTLVGAAVGAVVGGLAGKGVAESIDPTVEDAYWRENYASRDYVSGDRSYDDYGPAYGYGVNSYSGDRSFEDVEPELAEGWPGARGASTLGWGEASPAARDAWERVGERSNRSL